MLDMKNKDGVEKYVIVLFSDNGSVTVVYRVTVSGSDGETHLESTGTVSTATNGQSVDTDAAAEK
ncbi:hypothetical protein R6Q59_004500 [Mikania micrantha]